MLLQSYCAAAHKARAGLTIVLICFVGVAVRPQSVCLQCAEWSRAQSASMCMPVYATLHATPTPTPSDNPTPCWAIPPAQPQTVSPGSPRLAFGSLLFAFGTVLLLAASCVYCPPLLWGPKAHESVEMLTQPPRFLPSSWTPRLAGGHHTAGSLPTHESMKLCAGAGLYSSRHAHSCTHHQIKLFA